MRSLKSVKRVPTFLDSRWTFAVFGSFKGQFNSLITMYRWTEQAYSSKL